MNRLIHGLMAAAFVTAVAASAEAQTDQVMKPDATVLADKVRLTKVSWQLVTWTDSKGKGEAKGSEVGDITFGDEPPSFQRAKNAAASGLPDKAAVLFEEALKEIETKKLRDWNKAPLFMVWASFLAERGNQQGALDMLKRLLTECGDTWWRPESYRSALAISKNRIEAQKAVLDEMKGEPEPLASEAEMGLAELAFTRGQHDEALATYQKVAGTAGSAYKDAASLGVFRLLKTLKRNAELDNFCAKLLADAATPPALQQAAGAWSAAGLLERAGKDKSKLRAAVIAAGKAIAVGPPERKEDAEDYVAALRVAAKGYVALSAEAAEEEQRQEYKARASGYLMEIVRAYKGTPWAETAQLEMQTLGVKEN